MSQLNLKQILSANNLSEVVEYVNYNFEQIILNGGGPKGTTGLIGPPGIPGKPGLIGASGATGETGTRVFVGAYNPGTTSGISPTPRIGDVFLDSEPTFINMYEFSGTGAWALIQTVSAPSSAWKSAKDYVGTGPDKAVIYNDFTIADRLLLGPSAYMGPSAAGGTSTVGPILDYTGGTAVTLASQISSGLGPLSFSNTILTIASKGNQIRLINPDSGVISGTGGTYSQFNVDGGGVIFSLTGSTGGTGGNQVLDIFNADLTGNKAFGVRLNGSNYSIYADKSNRILLGGSSTTTLFNTLSVAGGAVFGNSYFGGQLQVPDSVAIVGRISIGSTALNSGNLTVYNSSPGSTGTMYLDTRQPLSDGSVSTSQFQLGSGMLYDAQNNTTISSYYSFGTEVTSQSGELSDVFKMNYKNAQGATVHTLFTVIGASVGGARVTESYSQLSTRLFIGDQIQPTAVLDILAGDAIAASLRIRESSVEPFSPNIGDIWFDGTAIFIFTSLGTRQFNLL